MVYCPKSNTVSRVKRLGFLQKIFSRPVIIFHPLVSLISFFLLWEGSCDGGAISLTERVTFTFLMMGWVLKNIALPGHFILA